MSLIKYNKCSAYHKIYRFIKYSTIATNSKCGIRSIYIITNCPPLPLIASTLSFAWSIALKYVEIKCFYPVSSSRILIALKLTLFIYTVRPAPLAWSTDILFGFKVKFYQRARSAILVRRRQLSSVSHLAHGNIYRPEKHGNLCNGGCQSQI